MTGPTTMRRITKSSPVPPNALVAEDAGRLFAETYERNMFDHLTRQTISPAWIVDSEAEGTGFHALVVDHQSALDKCVHARRPQMTDPIAATTPTVDPTTQGQTPLAIHGPAAPTPIPDPTPPVLHRVAPYTPDELNSRIIEQSLDPQRLGATLLVVRHDHDQLKATVAQIAEWVNAQIQGQSTGKRTAAK